MKAEGGNPIIRRFSSFLVSLSLIPNPFSSKHPILPHGTYSRGGQFFRAKSVARPEVISAEKLLDFHPPPACRLDAPQLDRPQAGGDHKPSLRRPPGPCPAAPPATGRFDHRGRAENQPHRRAVRPMPEACRSSAKGPSPGCGSWMASAGRRQSISPSVFFSRGAFEARAGSCGRASNRPGLKAIDRLPHQPRPQRPPAAAPILRPFRPGGWGHGPGRCTARRRLRRHVDDRHAGFGLAVVDGPVDRGRPAILRQQRGVQIDATAIGRRPAFPGRGFAHSRRRPADRPATPPAGPAPRRR